MPHKEDGKTSAAMRGCHAWQVYASRAYHKILYILQSWEHPGAQVSPGVAHASCMHGCCTTCASGIQRGTISWYDLQATPDEQHTNEYTCTIHLEVRTYRT